MTRILAALRALVYMTGFVLAWGYLALAVRPLGSSLTLPPGSRPIGATLMVLGGTLVLWCAASFVVHGRGTPAPFDAPRSFVARGPYRWVRNPMYLGALPVLIGFGMWHGSLSMILLAAPAAVLAHLFVIWYEEPTLRRRFGGQYEAYLHRVPRWTPRRRNCGREVAA